MTLAKGHYWHNNIIFYSITFFVIIVVFIILEKSPYIWMGELVLKVNIMLLMVGVKP